MQFNPSPRHTVGVEWELQLIDPETLDLYDGIMPLMEFFPATDFVKPEYIQSCVELTSRISENSGEAIEHLRETLVQTLRRCDELDMSVCGAGTHPFCRRLALITPLPRYQRLAHDRRRRALQPVQGARRDRRRHRAQDQPDPQPGRHAPRDGRVPR